METCDFRLEYEALTVAVAAIKQRVETPDEVAKKLPPQEKDQRLQVSQLFEAGLNSQGCAPWADDVNQILKSFTIKLTWLTIHRKSQVVEAPDIVVM